MSSFYNMRFLYFILFSLIFSQAFAITIDMGAIRKKARETSRITKVNQTSEEIKLNVISHKIKSGLNVYIIPKKDSNGNSAVFLWVKSGASDEMPDFFGGAHILEHIVFKGSPERGISEVSDAIERVGGYINAWTSYDNTVYWTLIPSEHILIPLEVLRDIIWNPAFSDEEFEREKEVVIEEWRRGQDIPSYRLYHNFFEQIYKDHPYGHPVIGYENTIKSIIREKVMDFHSSFYSPENTFLVLVGDFDSKKILEEVKRIFGKIEGNTKTKPKKLDPAVQPKFSGPKSFFITGKEKESHTMVGFIGYPYSISYSVYFDIISDILEKRLYKRLRIDDLVVNSVDVDYWSPKGIGLFEIFYSARGENIKKALDIIYEELQKIRSFGVSEKELESAKNSILSDFYKNFQSVRSIATTIGYSIQLAEDPLAPYKYIEILKTVNNNEILKILKDTIDESKLLVGTYVNEDDKKYAEEISSYHFKKKDLELPFSFVETKEGIKKYISENGVRVLIKKIEGTGTISVVSVFPGGNIFYNKPGIPNLTAKVITRGTKSKSADMILDEIKSIGGSLNASASFDTFSVSSSFLKDKHEKGFQIFFDVILNPSFDEKEMEKMREDILEDLRVRYDNPQVQAVDEFMALLFENTPYSFPDGISIEVLKSATRSDIIEFWKFATSDPENIVIAIAGDIGNDQDILKSLYFYGEELFKKKKEKDIKFPEKIKCNSEGREKKVKREGNQVHILAGFCSPSLLDGKETIAFQLISASVSGMGGRFFMNLREKKGLAYVAAPIRRSFLLSGLFGGYIASAPEKAEESLKSLKEEIQNITNLEDSEFERGKNLVLGSIRRELQSNSSWAQTLAQDEFLKRGFDFFMKIQQEIKNMKKEEALSIFNQYISKNNVSVLILGGVE